MTNTEKFILQASSGEKLDLSPSNARLKVWICIIFTVVFSISIISYILLEYGLTWTTLFSSMALVSLFVLTILAIIKDYSIVAVKSGNLIISEWNKDRYYVASVRSVKKLNTIKLGTIHFTSFNFYLDGRSKRAVIIKRIKQSDPEPELVIRKLKEEKEKANL